LKLVLILRGLGIVMWKHVEYHFSKFLKVLAFLYIPDSFIQK